MSVDNNWHEKYVYVNSEKGFYNLDTGNIEELEEFNLHNSKHVVNSKSAFAHASKYGLIQGVSKKAYRPDVSINVFIEDGKRVVNTFNNALASSVPIARGYEDDYILDVEVRMGTHIAYLSGSYEQASLLIDWIAHQVQNPGVKIPFCPVIIGFPGSGKGYIRALLRTILGEPNIGVVNPDGIESKYNSWATDKLVVAMEELNIKGNNRVETLNKLKPLITNEYVMINEYGEKIRKVKNVTNFFGLSNYSDALPLQGNDRRYWIIKSKYETGKELQDVIQEDLRAYFDRLYNDLEHGTEILLRYFQDHDISEKFKTTKRAPMTHAKRHMIDAEQRRSES